MIKPALAFALALFAAALSGADKPLHRQPLDLPDLSLAEGTAEDFGIDAMMSRSEHPKGSPARHFEKGMLLKRAADHLFNRSRYKSAYRLYQQAEAELKQAAERHDRDAETRAKRDAYYHLGLVCERIRNDKSIAADCFAKARELDPEAGYLTLKLSRTKEGRARLGVRSAQDFRRLSQPRTDRETSEATREGQTDGSTETQAK